MDEEAPRARAANAPWLARFELPLVRRLVGRRAFELAIAGRLRYVVAPSVAGNLVRATLRDDATDAGLDAARVEAEVTEDDAALAGECTRCRLTFGPCVHLATLAVDLGGSAALRERLLDGRSTRELADKAPGARAALAAELRFETALRGWIAPTAGTERLELAASPWTDDPQALGQGYGDRATQGRQIAIYARRAGERRLLAARDLYDLTAVAARDRRVLEQARDRSPGRKSFLASGVGASLALEAMRVHGRVHTLGFKHLLDFRPELVRPTIALDGARREMAEAREESVGTPEEGVPRDPLDAFDTLRAGWVTDDRRIQVACDDGAFFPGPFPFVWTREGAIYRVAPDVDLAFARQLADSPALLVPPGRLRDAGAELLRASRGRGVLLPDAERFGLPPIETPRVVLRLTGEPLCVEAELLAVYRGRTVDLFHVAATGGLADAAGDEGRDVDLEGRVIATVMAAGLAPDARANEDDEAPPGRVTVAGERAIDLWARGILALQAAEDPPIEIELAKRLTRVRVGAALGTRVHVVLEGNWLHARLDFHADQVPVEMDRIRAALARKERWVSLSDGTLARITASVEELVDEATEVLGGNEEARLPAHQLGRLDRWLEEHDGRMDAAVEALRGRLRALAVAEKPKMPRGLKTTLRPYQKRGLAWLQFLRALGAGGILADDMGLGKTVMTLAFLAQCKQADGPAPSLVVCPTSVATNWVREAARFTPGLRVELLHGSGRATRSAQDNARLREADLLVTTYALLRRDVETLAQVRFRCVALDEAQNIKNADSETRRAAMRLDAEMRLALSGTPVENRLRELWSLASFVNPGILGTSRAFEARFERPIASNPRSPLTDELRAVVRPFLLRRTKDDVLSDLPPKTEIDRYVTLTLEDKKLYDALAHQLRANVARDLERRGSEHMTLSVFTALTRLRQMACDPALVDSTLVRGKSAKRETFLALVRELVAEGRRALVFSQFVQLLTLWRADLDAEGIAYEYLDGSTTKRDEVVARFQEGRAPLFLVSLKAGGSGLNLTAADTVIHCDPWWNPAVEDQATDRAHRIGQDKPVTVVRLIARGTIEEKILALKGKKRELVAAVVKDDAGALRGLRTEDLTMLLGDSDAADG